jgi:hypothetical protein
MTAPAKKSAPVQSRFCFLESPASSAARSSSATLGELLKRAGQTTAAAARTDCLLRARELLVGAAERRIALGLAAEFTSDDAHDLLACDGWPAGSLGNAAGSVFRGAAWKLTARRRKSSRPARHAGEISVWVYTKTITGDATQ